jgi:hypothetical protein
MLYDLNFDTWQFILKYLTFDDIRKLYNTSIFFQDKVIDYTLNAKFMTIKNIEQIIEESHFTFDTFFKYIINIECDNCFDETNPLIFESNNSETYQTIQVFKILQRFVKLNNKSQFKNKITTRMIKFCTQYLKHKYNRYDMTYMMFLNLLVYHNECEWEKTECDIYKVYEELHFEKDISTFNQDEHSIKMINILLQRNCSKDKLNILNNVVKY